MCPLKITVPLTNMFPKTHSPNDGEDDDEDYYPIWCMYWCSWPMCIENQKAILPIMEKQIMPINNSTILTEVPHSMWPVNKIYPKKWIEHYMFKGTKYCRAIGNGIHPTNPPELHDAFRGTKNIIRVIKISFKPVQVTGN